MSAELLHHRLLGDAGDVILLLNGGMMTHSSWEPISSGLVARYRILLCDFRGQLLSPGDSHTTLAGNADDLLALLDALELERVHLFGASFGAEVGLILAALQPARVLSLAAVTAVDRTPPGMREDSIRMKSLAREILDGAGVDAFHDRLAEGIYSPSYRQANAALFEARRARVALLPPAWYQGLFGILTSVEDFDVSSLLRRIECPTLVLHAAGDAMMPETRVRALAEGVDDAEFHVHPNAGHALVAEDPEWVLGQYLAFLRRRFGA